MTEMCWCRAGDWMEHYWNHPDVCPERPERPAWVSWDDVESVRYAACGHGSDDEFSCFGCQFEVSIGPEIDPDKRPKRRTVVYAWSFVENMRQISGDHRWPLRGA